MSESADATPPTDAPAPAGRSLPLPLVLAVVVGLAAGVGGGLFAVGPALAKGIAPAVTANAAHAKGAKGGHGEEGAGDEEGAGGEAAADEGEGGEGGDDAKGEHAKEGEAASVVYTLDNLVLNPAESGGTRFLLLSISFELKNQESHDAMKSRDAELRDMILATLGGKTVEQLSDMTSRDSLKVELRSAAAKMLKKKTVKRVYFPQFVIQ